MSDPVIKDAIKIRDRLLDVAKEIRHRTQRSDHKATHRMGEFDAAYCETAAKMLEKLGHEVFRLRESIGLYYCNRMTTAELRRTTETWNDPTIDLPRLAP